VVDHEISNFNVMTNHDFMENTMTTTRHIPKEFTQELSSEKTVQVAMKELTSVDTCPVCNTAMRILSVNGHESFCCINDRIVMPIL